MTPLSIYVLTFNSEKYLSAILQAVAPLADDLLVVDSGSSDQTVAIATQCGARVLYRPFDDFRQQRDFAQQQCRHDHVFFLDSDEIPSPELVAHLQQLKQSGFQHDAYAIQRDWIVMGQQVHALYPVGCPDYPVRIIEKTGFACPSKRCMRTLSAIAAVAGLISPSSTKPSTPWTKSTAS
jgi:glycosyltransferase involved in cell wall biosynthesis